MRQIWIPRAGGPEVLEIREGRDPLPGPREVRVRVEAIGVSGADVAARRRTDPDARLPLVPGLELAGRIDTVGAEVGTDWVDRDVLAFVPGGAYSDVLCVAEHHVFARPAGLSAPVAAALPVDYLTAYQAIAVMGRPAEEDRVLVQPADHGSGIAAIQLAARIGTRVIGVAPAISHDILKALGIEHAIDPTTEDVALRVSEVTMGRGVELALCGSGPRAIREAYRCLAPTGRLGLLGLPAIAPETGLRSRLATFRLPRFRADRLAGENRGVFGVHPARLWDEQDRLTRWIEDLLRGVEAGDLRPAIAGALDFEDVVRAHERAETPDRPGKLLLTLSGDLG